MEEELELDKLKKRLDTHIKYLIKNGKEYAKAYRDYRVELAKELIKLKDEGYAITLASDIARGKEEIADLKFKEISNEAIYKATMEAINSDKLQIKILNERINREYKES